MISSNDFNSLVTGARRMAHRFKIKKPDGHFVPIDDPEIIKIDNQNTGAYDYNTVINTEYKFFLADVYNKRNRLIIVNDNAISHVSKPVVTIIDLDAETISYGGRAFGAGWPTTVTTKAHNAYFNQETQKLYIAYTTLGAFEPGVIIVDCKLPGAELENCAGMVDSDTYLDCLSNWTLPFSAAKDTGYCALLTISGGRLYYFYVYDGADYAAATAYPSHFGYFDTTTGAYTIMWTWGKPATGVGPATEIKPNAAPTFLSEIYGLLLTDWQYVESTNTVILAFKPRAPGISYGWESHIIEIALDEQNDLANPSANAFYTTTTSATATQTSPTNWQYAACELIVDTINLRDYIDPNIDQFISCYITRASTSISTPVVNIGTSVWEGNISNYAVPMRTIIPVDPLDTQLYIKLGTDTELNATSPSSVLFTIYLCKYPAGVQHSVSVVSGAPLRRTGDTDRPTIELDACPGLGSDQFNQSSDLSDTEYAYFTQLRKAGDYYIAAAYDEGGLPLGLWRIKNDGSEIVRYTTGTPLQSDYIRFIESINGESCLVACGKGAAPEDAGGRVFYYDGYSGEFAFDGAYWDFTPVSGGVGIIDMAYTRDWLAIGTRDEIWIFLADKGARSRFVRNWWDGSDPDAIVGAGGDIYLDNAGRVPGFENVTFQHSKGEASYKLTFTVNDACYLPWISGEYFRVDGQWVIPLFNENVGAPGTFSGTLQDGAKIIYERGVLQDSGLWEFYPEGQVFVCKQPAMAEGGIAQMNVECLGPVGALLSRAIYQQSHFPEETAVTGGTMVTDDNLTYWYEDSGVQVTDWATAPAPVIYVAGVQVFNYTLHTSAGTVIFYADPGAAVTCDITYYEPGTNEAENIIMCILKHANEVGGAGFDESYFTGTLTGEVLATTDNYTYSFSKSNVRHYLNYPEVSTADPSNKIYRDGVEVTTGFTWDYSDGSVTFAADQSAYVITGDYTYYTIQKSGITLRAITFSPKQYNTAYDCINEVCRRVAPNYIFHELPDGRVCADFYTMQAAGSEDIVIDNSHILLTAVADNPMRYDLATYVIGYGQAPLSELPNVALGKTVTDQWTHGWHAGVNVQVITDGNSDTQATSGWGRWSEGTYAVQQAILASNPDGTAVVYIDLTESVEAETIIFARGTQSATEGDAGGVCRWSLWESDDAITFTRLVDNFVCPPSQNVQFKAEINWDKGRAFRYLQVRLHDIGLYKHKGNTDSQIGLSEVQVFGAQEIEGISALISDTTLAENSEFRDVLRRWGNLVHVARNGQPDPALYTQDKVNEDSEQILNEMKRLLSQVEARAIWLPGIPIFSTIKITNAALARTMTMLVESKTITGDGDTFTGSKYP